MNVRPFCLCLPLLASLGILGASPAAAGSEIHAGEMELALPASPVAVIPIDTAALAEQICEEDPSKRRILVTCHAIVKSQDVADLETGAAGAPASALRVSAEPVTTPCGLWNATLTLAPIRLQPVFQKAFEEVSDDAERAVSAMVLEMSTNLRLANRETGQTIDFALHPGDGTDPWGLTLTGRSRASILFADKSDRPLVFEGCIPRKYYDNPQYEVIDEEGCGACPEE